MSDLPIYCHGCGELYLLAEIGKHRLCAAKPEKAAPGRPQRASTELGEARVLVANKVDAGSSRVANRVANRHGKYADVEARRVYMRDLMRRHRAEKSA